METTSKESGRKERQKKEGCDGGGGEKKGKESSVQEPEKDSPNSDGDEGDKTNVVKGCEAEGVAVESNREEDAESSGARKGRKKAADDDGEGSPMKSTLLDYILADVMDHCVTTTQSSRDYMETHLGQELPTDYVTYPGKMDHTTCLIFRGMLSLSNCCAFPIAKDSCRSGEEIAETARSILC